MREKNQGIVAELPYTEGSVWSVRFVRTEPGKTRAYLKSLGAEWKRLMDEAKRQSVILSYRILVTSIANRDVWDVMLVVEVKNMAALDGFSEKMAAVATKVAMKRSEFGEILSMRLL